LHYGFPVMTAQEKELLLNDALQIMKEESGCFEVKYSAQPQPEFCKNWSAELREHNLSAVGQKLHHFLSSKNSAQMTLF
jgi:hypothetical protein